MTKTSREQELAELGRRMAAARTAANLGQKEVAAKLGVARETVSDWERGGFEAGCLHVRNMERLYRTVLLPRTEEELIRDDQAAVLAMAIDHAANKVGLPVGKFTIGGHVLLDDGTLRGFPEIRMEKLVKSEVGTDSVLS